MAAARLPLLALPVRAGAPAVDHGPVAPHTHADADPDADADAFERVRAWWRERQRYSVVQAGVGMAFLIGTLFLSAFTLPLLLRW